MSIPPRQGVARRPPPVATAARPADAVLRLQRTAGNAAVGRLLARQARASAPSPACPSREPGEVERSRTGKGVLIDDVRPVPNGILVSDFGIGRSDVKAETGRDPDLRDWIATFERDPISYRISILGLDDCIGSPAVREKLRKSRAESVRDVLGPQARQRVGVADGAPLEDYAADNLSAAGRAKNRGALVMFEPRMRMLPTRITVPKPTYPRVGAINCTDDEAEQLAVATTIAIRMVENAIASITGGASPEVNAIMRKYFNDDSSHTRATMYRVFRRILNGLTNDASYLCVDTSWFGGFGPPLGPILISRRSLQRPGVKTFPPPENDLAALVIHEACHKFELTFGTQYCDDAGCGSALSPGDAVRNPDSYAYFAKELFTSGL